MTAPWQWLAANWPNVLALWIAFGLVVVLLLGGVVRNRNRQVPDDEDQPQP